jgi:hypothetical protein
MTGKQLHEALAHNTGGAEDSGAPLFLSAS